MPKTSGVNVNLHEVTAGETPRELLTLPTWTPGSVIGIIRSIENSDLTLEQRRILGRLALNPRMQRVWGELLKRKKPSRDFAYPARQEQYPQLRSQHDLQNAALREIFHFTFCAARDKMAVTRLPEILQNKNILLQNGAMLRALAHDLGLSRSNREFGVTDAVSSELAANDVASLDNVANWLEHVVSALRQPGDPLMVAKHRGNPIVRGVHTLIATKLYEIVGKPLDRTAATLASVALDTEANPRAGRYAVTNSRKRKARKSKRVSRFLRSAKHG
jgi:hypothetical protein